MIKYRLRQTLAKLQNTVNSYTGRKKELLKLIMPEIEAYNKKILEKWNQISEDLLKKSFESFTFDYSKQVMKEKGLPDFESLSPELQKKIHDSFDSLNAERECILENEIRKKQENLQLKVEIIILEQVIEGIEFRMLQEVDMDATLRAVATEISKIPQEKLFDAVTKEVKPYGHF